MSEFQDGLLCLSVLLAQAPKLEEVIIESPLCDHRGQWQGRDGWDQTLNALLMPLELAASPIASTQLELPLRRLKKLTLHLSGKLSPFGNRQFRLWIVEKTWARIFAHPTLEELCLSCAAFPPTAFKDVLHFPRTPLKKLKLVECSLTHEAVHDMLSLPLALESLHLGEERHTAGMNLRDDDDIWQVYPAHIYNHLWERDLPKVMRALQQQAPTLRFLSYIAEVDQNAEEIKNENRSLGQDRIPGFSSFTNLQEIFFSDCFLLHHVLLHKAISAPPNLRVYSETCPPFSPRVTASLTGYSQLIEKIASESVSVPEVNAFQLDSPLHRFREDGNADLTYQGNLNAVAQSFRDRRTRLRLWGYDDLMTGGMPPHLYGRQRNVRLRFDSDAAGFDSNSGWVCGGWQPNDIENN